MSSTSSAPSPHAKRDAKQSRPRARATESDAEMNDFESVPLDWTDARARLIEAARRRPVLVLAAGLGFAALTPAPLLRLGCIVVGAVVAVQLLRADEIAP